MNFDHEDFRFNLPVIGKHILHMVNRFTEECGKFTPEEALAYKLQVMTPYVKFLHNIAVIKHTTKYDNHKIFMSKLEDIRQPVHTWSNEQFTTINRIYGDLVSDFLDNDLETECEKDTKEHCMITAFSKKVSNNTSKTGRTDNSLQPYLQKRVNNMG